MLLAYDIIIDAGSSNFLKILLTHIHKQYFYVTFSHLFSDYIQ